MSNSVQEQRKWIEDRGGDLAGYIQRYGDPDQFYCYGDGGTAIYNADMAELQRLEALENGEPSDLYAVVAKHSTGPDFYLKDQDRDIWVGSMRSDEAMAMPRQKASDLAKEIARQGKLTNRVISIQRVI